MYCFVQGEWERTEVRKDSTTTVSGLYLPLLPWDETCAHGLLSVCWLSIRCSRNVGKKPPRNVMRAEHLCSVEIWACRQRNGLCESGAIVFSADVFSQYSGVFLLSGSESWSHRWFLASSVEGQWLKGEVKKGCVETVKEIESLVRGRLVSSQ